MIVYNVTVSVDPEISKEWQHWMKSKHIPDVLATGIFNGFKFLQLMNETEDNQGETFAIQYFCESMEDLNTYMDKYATALQNEHTIKYKGKFVAFRTILKEI